MEDKADNIESHKTAGQKHILQPKQNYYLQNKNTLKKQRFHKNIQKTNRTFWKLQNPYWRTLSTGQAMRNALISIISRQTQWQRTCVSHKIGGAY